MSSAKQRVYVAPPPVVTCDSERDTQASDLLLPCPPLPQIEPLSGPLDGGTLLTIRGRNLGRRLSDVEHGVWIGSVACEPLVDRYTVSEE